MKTNFESKAGQSSCNHKMSPGSRRINKKKIDFFFNHISGWFRESGRRFPWRKQSATNYEKIISEVLLQRTRAETAAKLLPHFLSKYPSWKKLSMASVEELEEILKPIGLQKQRSKRLYSLAQEMGRRRGRFPAARGEIEIIPMLGQYITNAVLLFVYGNPEPLLDVNMSRVLERFFGPRRMSDIRYDPYLQRLARKIISYGDYKTMNWAVLDFAALVCKARKPSCEICQLAGLCKFFKSKSKNRYSHFSPDTAS